MMLVMNNLRVNTNLNDAASKWGGLKKLPLCLLTMISFLMSMSANAQTYYFKPVSSSSTVTTNAVTNWLYSTDSSGVTTPYTAPSSGTLTTYLGASNSVITLTGSSTMTIPTATSFTISGTFHADYGTVTPIIATGNLTFASGSIFEFNHPNAGTIASPTSISPILPAPATTSWNANSTIVINGFTGNDVLSSANGTFGNLIVNAPTAYYSTIYLVAVASGAAGSLTFNNVSFLTFGNGKTKMFNNNAGATACTLNVNGNYYCNNLSTMPALLASALTAGNVTMNIAGSVTGVIGSGIAPAATYNNTLNLTGYGTLNVGVLNQLPNSLWTKVNINGNYTLLSGMAGYTSSPYTTFTVNGTLDCGAFAVSGTLSVFVLSNGATIKTSLATGINGAVTTTGANSFSPSANYEFYGTAGSAITGLAMPTTVNNLTVNNATGLKQSAATTVNGNLNLVAGAFNLNSLTLTMASASNIVRLGGSLSATPTFTSTVNVAYGNSLTTSAATTYAAYTASYTTSAATTVAATTTTAAVAASTTITTNSATTNTTFGIATTTTSASANGVVLTPSAATASGTTLTFANTAGVAVGQTVTGTNIPGGTTVSSFTGTTVVLSGSGVTGAGVAVGANIVFTGTLNNTATNILNVTSATGITTGMCVTANNSIGIPPGTTVTAISGTSITISNSITSGTAVLSGATVVFGGNVLSFSATTGALVGQIMYTGASGGFAGGSVASTVTSTAVTVPYPVSATISTNLGIKFLGSVLPVTSTSGIVAGQTVFGPNIQPGVSVSSINGSTVILSNPVNGAVSSGSAVSFGGNVLTFASTTGITVGQVAIGTNIPTGDTVVAVTATTVTLSAPVTSTGVASGATVIFGSALYFANTSGIAAGQTVTGTNIPAATTVSYVTSRAVYLSKAVTGTIASGAAINFSTSAITTGVELPTSTSALTNLSINNINGVTLNAAATVNGTLTLSQALTNTNTLTLANNATIARTASSGTLSATPVFGASASDAVNVTISGSATSGNELLGTTGKIGLLTVNGAGITYTLASSPTVTGIALTSGTLADGGNTITNTGNVTGTGTESGSGNITMTSSGATISGATLNNLILNNSGGFSLTGSATVGGTLTLTSGNLSLGSNNLTVNASNAVAGTPSTSKHIVTSSTGYITTTAAFSSAYTFPVGFDGTNYNPVTITPNAQTPTVKAQAIGTASTTLSNSLKAQWLIGGLTSSSTTLAFPWDSNNDPSSVAQTSGLLYKYAAGWSAITQSSTTGSSSPYTTSLTGVAITNPIILTVGEGNAAPTLTLTSGSNAQTVNSATAIASIEYTYGGSATTANVTWTGTADANTPPSGISVTPNSGSETVTISGTPSVSGVYGYSISTVTGAPVVTLAGTITVTAAPLVTMASVSTVVSANIIAGITGYPLTNFSVASSAAAVTISAFNLPISVGGGLVTSDLVNYKLYYTTANTFTSPTLLSTVTSALATTPIGFSSFSQTINSGSIGYFWVTTDVASTATSTRTISASSFDKSNLTFSVNIDPSSSGTIAAGGTQTIIYPVYYNVAGSDISQLSNWGTNANGSGTNPPNFTNPNATFNINNATTNTVGSNLTISGAGTVVNLNATSGLTINSTFTFTISSASLIIANGGTITINGTLVNSGTLTNSTTTAKFIVNGTYQHSVNGSSVPIATWNSGSILNVTGMTSTNVGNMNQNFSNIIWNCPSQSSNANWTWRNNAISISGNIQILATGPSGSVKTIGLTDGLSTTSNYTISGNVSISGNSMLSSNASSAAGLILGITINGNLTIGTGSTYSFHAATLAQTNTINLKGNFSNAGTLTSNNVGDANTLNFTGNGVQTYANSGTILGTLTATSFVVAASSTLDMGATSSIPSNILFTLSSGATLQTANTNGVSGSILSSSPNLNANANYIFNGVVAQTTGTSFSTANNLTINNSAGVTVNSAKTINGTLDLTSGALNPNSLLTMGNTATIIRTGGTITASPTFGTAVNVIYNQNGSATTTGAEIPSSASVLNNLTINTSNGVSLGSNASVNGTLTLTSGQLTLGSNNLALAVANPVVGTPSVSKHIITNGSGYVTTTAANNTAYTFPIGFNASNYNPVIITPTSETPTVKVAAITPALTNSLKAMWTIGGVTATSSEISFPWISGTDNVATAQKSGMVYSYDGSSWGTALDNSGTSGSNPNYTSTINGTAFSNPSILTVGAPSAAKLVLTSGAGTDAQTVNNSTAVTDITYEFSGSASTASVSWTGTSGSATPPTGISVDVDVINNIVTISGTATIVGNYGYTLLTDGSPTATKSGTISIITTPVAVLATSTPVTVGNIFAGTTDNQLSNFSIAVSGSTATFSGVSLPISLNGLVAADLVNYKLYYTTTNTFSNSTLLATVTTGLTSSPISFSGFSRTIASGSTGYFWITTDVSASASLNHSITASAILTSNLTFTGSTNKSGSAGAQGTQTITYPTYYNVVNSDISSLNNWGDNSDGTGVHPVSFAVSHSTYNLKNGTTNRLSTNTTFSGTGTVLVIGDSTHNAGLTVSTTTLTVGTATTSTGSLIISPLGTLTIGTAANLTVAAGGSLNVSNTTATMTVNGYLRNSGAVTNAGVLTVSGSGSTYEHNINGGTVPTATWGTNSTCLVNAVIATTPSNLAQNFYHFTWNCPSQTTTSAGPIFSTLGQHIYGNLSISNTGASGVLRFFGMIINTTEILTVDGNFNISGTSIVHTNGSSGKGYAVYNIGGDYSIASGCSFYANKGSGGSSCVINMLNGNFSNLGTFTTNTLATDSIAILFKKNGTQTFTNSGTLPTTLANTFVNVNSGTTLNVTSSSATPSLNVNSGGTLINTATLNVNNSLINNGIISGSGTVVLAGTLAQTITGNGTINNFKLNNSAGATITSGNNKLNVLGVLTLQTGTLTTNSNLVFKSTSIANSAVLASVPASGTSISGTATVERFIPKGFRAYRDLSAGGVYNTSNTLFNTWQENGSYSNNGYGMFITGKLDTTTKHNLVDGTTGLDHSLTGSPSAFYYKAGWDTVWNTNAEKLNPFQSYRVLVRGDRSFDLDTTPINAINGPLVLGMYNSTSLRASGSLITGNVVYSRTGVTNAVTGATYNTSAYGLNPAANSYTYIANPYACPIDFKSIYTNNRLVNVQPYYYYLDPTIGSTGAWVVYNAFSNVSTKWGSNGEFIQAGQGFLIKDTSLGAPTLTITEADKSILASSKTGVFGTTSINSGLSINLLKQSGASYLKMDAAIAVFGNKFSNGIGIEDAGKMSNASDNLSIVESGKNLSIDGRLPATSNDVLGIGLAQLSGANYQLVINSSDFVRNGVAPYINDAYTNKTTALSSGIDTIAFTAVPKVAATYQNRFSIVFKPTTLYVNSIVANAISNGNTATITWNTVGENGVGKFEVEKSTDGTNFAKIGEESAKNTTTASYSATDNSAIASTNYYRIKAISTDGTIAYSNIAKVTYNLQLTTYNLFPNPLTGKALNVQLGNAVTGKYIVSITNALGQKVAEHVISHTGGTATHSINIGHVIAAGLYNVSILSKESKQIIHSSAITIN